jgi:HNH endonuclease
MRARQGMRAYVHVPRTPFSIAAGLPDLNGREVVLVRRSSVVASRCWVVDPPLCTTFRRAAQDPDGRELLPGHQHQLPALPEAWMTARAPTWSGEDLAFLREHYGTLPTAAIAERLGRGLAATRSKVEDLHLRCRTVWTPELDEILAELFPDTAATALAEVLGATAAAIRQRAMTLGIKKAPDFAAECARSGGLARSPFTPEISEVIELLYPDTLTQDIADLIGMSLERVHAYANHKGWKKTKQFMRDTARERTGPDHPMRRHQFPKGHVPANKGVKGISYPGMEATQFKKGQMPYTWQPIGTLRINADGYLDRKVSDTRARGFSRRDWVPVHRLVWIEANGPVPEGHIVRFKDGMRTTDVEKITPDILECITRAEHGMRNVWHANLPPDLRKVVGARIALNRMINKRQRQLAEERT